MFNIFEDITWLQFTKYPRIAKLPLHEQVQYYNQYLQELSKAAIKNQEVLNNDSYDNSNEDEEIKEEVKSETSSKKSLTVNDLKEQCKSLGIKGYSKKNKEELIEMIKNHKSI